MSGKKIRHGMARTRLYHVWQDMKSRCLKKYNKAYMYYGGRGISMLSEWNEFQPFMIWAVLSGYRDNLELDRIDTNGNYEPSNCRWTTRKVQANNTTRNRYITLNGKKQSMSDWCTETSMPYQTIKTRINKLNWTAEKAFTTPVRHRVGV